MIRCLSSSGRITGYSYMQMPAIRFGGERAKNRSEPLLQALFPRVARPPHLIRVARRGKDIRRYLPPALSANILRIQKGTTEYG
jgi:hypothetical protein